MVNLSTAQKVFLGIIGAGVVGGGGYWLYQRKKWVEAPILGAAEGYGDFTLLTLNPAYKTQLHAIPETRVKVNLPVATLRWDSSWDDSGIKDVFKQGQTLTYAEYKAFVKPFGMHGIKDRFLVEGPVGFSQEVLVAEDKDRFVLRVPPGHYTITRLKAGPQHTYHSGKMWLPRGGGHVNENGFVPWSDKTFKKKYVKGRIDLGTQTGCRIEVYPEAQVWDIDVGTEDRTITLQPRLQLYLQPKDHRSTDNNVLKQFFGWIFSKGIMGAIRRIKEYYSKLGD